MTEDNSLALLLKELMRRHKRLPSQLAADIGISHATMSRWLSGKDIPSTKSCRKLAEFSSIPVQEFLIAAGHTFRTAEIDPPRLPEFREYAQKKYPAELDEDAIIMIEELIERRRAKKYAEKTPRWETELWKYLSRGDGTCCPLYKSCQLRLDGVWCLSDNEDYYKAKKELIDNDEFDSANPAGIDFQFQTCPKSGEIFTLVTKLAIRFQDRAGIDRLPVPANLITQAYDNLPIEVRQAPLKVCHGAIRHLSDYWLVYLNSNDTPARRRFTLYHEIFHILVHSKANPEFKETSCSRDGSFNELLADHFSAVILLPREWVRKIWSEVKDISQMATIFEVPKTVMYIGLRSIGII